MITAEEPSLGQAARRRLLWSYGLGDIGTGMAATQLGFYLFVFYTGVAGLPAWMAGLVLMVLKVWDGINDPLVGWLSDHTKHPWGPRLPWMAGSALPLGLALVAMWWVPPGGDWQKFAILVAIQLVEHLTRTQLSELFELAKRKLKLGSKIVFETINPQSLLALSSNYFRDPTHVWPQHPDTLGYTATLAGLKIVETRYLSPVSPNHMLREVPEDSNQPPPMLEATRRINQNIEQLNRLLYGFQDYALVLEVL
jgi:hypothetical protein